MPELSIVIPIFDEEKNLEPLYSGLKSVLNSLSKPYEIIFVDDGSSDGSFNILKTIRQKDETVKVIRLSKNYGQTAALAAGFEHAKGNVLIPMDADLQNDPQDIPNLLNKMQEGYDIVSGWRKQRQDPLFTKKIPSLIANRLISIITGVSLHDYGCTLKAYKKDVIQNIQLYGEMHRFLPALASWRGVSMAEIPVKHHARKHGKTKYGLSRTGRVVLDLITVKFLLNFSTRPIQLFGGLAFLLFFLGFISGVSVILMKLFQAKDMTGNPLLYLTILLLVGCLQFIMMGLLAEIIIRFYHQSNKNSTYAIKELI